MKYEFQKVYLPRFPFTRTRESQQDSEINVSWFMAIALFFLLNETLGE